MKQFERKQYTKMSTEYPFIIIIIVMEKGKKNYSIRMAPLLLEMWNV